MDKILIVPWDVDERKDEKLFVPDYIHRIKEQVLQHYDFSVKSTELVTTKSDKGGAIWKLESSAGPKSLKLLHRRPTRSLFSVGAQEYLVDVQKAKVPPIVKTRDGKSYVEAGGKLWLVAEWIEPLFPVAKNIEGAKQLCYALGEFHRLSKGYVPPKQAEVSSRLYKWPKMYEKVLNKMDWFRNIAVAYDDLPASIHLLDVIDRFEEQAKDSLERLMRSSYFELVKNGNQYWGLAHQDYGWSNGQMGADGMWIIDLDGVAYDLPIRDLRKLISGKMADLYRWDITWVREMIKAYHEANPISPQLYEVLMIDLSLPNEFYRNIKDIVYQPELFLSDPATISIIRTNLYNDQTKWPVLEEIINDWKE